MSGDPDRRLARAFALGLGFAFLAIAILELVTDALDPLLHFTGPMNALHWTVGAILLLSLLGGGVTTVAIVRIVGLALLALGIASLLAPDTMGDLFVFGEPMPVAYAVLHGISGAALLAATLVGGRVGGGAADGVSA
jgi:hypothetical protein